MKKFNGRLVTESKGLSPLLNVWKFFGKLRKKHRKVQKTNIPTSFRNFLKNFENLRKPSEVFGCLRTFSENLSSKGTKRYVLFTVYLALFFGVPFAVIAVIQKKIYSFAKHHATEIQAQQNATVLGRAKEKNRKAAKEVAMVTFAFMFFSCQLG